MSAKRSLLAAVAASLVLAAACSSDDGDGAAEAEPAGQEQGAGAGEQGGGDGGGDAGVERFTGSVGDFYVVPEDLQPGEPGELIRTMPIEAPEGQAGLRIMYWTTDAEDDPRAATGVVVWPEGEAPEGGWPILAWTHGTSGLAPHCAPSREPYLPPAYGLEGVLVAPDYVGLGPEGELHPYLSAAAEGNATVDAVAAVRSLPEVGAGDRWLVAGVSQGGHAALVAAERAAERLPEAELVGTVAIAPGAQLGESYGDDLQIRVIVTMVLVGAAAEDPSIRLEDHLGPSGLQAAELIRERCIGDIVTQVPPLATRPDYFVQDPRDSALGDEWVAENDPGQVRVDAPLLLVQGGQDVIVVPERTKALLERLCGLGQVVETVDVPEATHDDIGRLAADRISAFVAARFTGEAPVDAC